MYNQRATLTNLLCRICAQEEKNCISVFSESGKRQEIEKKIRVCLPLIIEEEDTLPKQICLNCLHKLDAAWEFFQLCKEGQVSIERKLYRVSQKQIREEPSHNYHRIDEKVQALSEEGHVIKIGESAMITLVPATEPTLPQEVPQTAVMAPVSSEPVGMMTAYQAADPTTTTAASTAVVSSPTTPENGVYPQGLIQVLPSSKPVLYQESNNVGQETTPVTTPQRNVGPTKRSMPSPRTNNPLPRRSLPISARRAMRGRGINSSSVPAPKRLLMMCKYCRKSFPDDIIDHHVSLHLRQSFFTCLDCNKNFRSELAMSRHRCGTNDLDKEVSIDLDQEQDDDLICL